MVGWLVLSGSSDLDWAQHPGCRVLDGVTEKAAQRHRHEGARQAGKSLEERSKIASIEAEAPIRTPPWTLMGTKIACIESRAARNVSFSTHVLPYVPRMR